MISPQPPTVLLLGGTGRTGGRVLEQLLHRGAAVRVVVRSPERLPADVASHPHLTVTVADLLRLSDEELTRQVQDCNAVISCLGHTTNSWDFRGTARLGRACHGEGMPDTQDAASPTSRKRFIPASSVSVNRLRTGHRRGRFEDYRDVARSGPSGETDNQHAADFLVGDIGAANRFVQWVIVRPDTLREGGITEYTLHEGLVDSLFRPGATNMANVALPSALATELRLGRCGRASCR